MRVVTARRISDLGHRVPPRSPRRAAAVFVALLCGCGPAPDFAPVDRTVASIHEEPLQAELENDAAVELEAVRLVPRARYEIAARLMSTERYRFDALSSVSPVDFALAWGAAADAAVQADLRIDQGNRWFYWRTRGDELPLPRRELTVGMANVHIIPADDATRAIVLGFEAGECVWLRGDLVDVKPRTDPALARRTSMSRRDAGAGSCEILLVRETASVPCE